MSDYICPNGHYVCENCRLAAPPEIIESVCRISNETNPFKIAELIMNHASFNQHGAEHHSVAAPCILTAVRNMKLADIADNQITSAVKRTNNIPYGACAGRGDCGAGLGGAVAVSIILGARYSSDTERSLVLKTAGETMILLSSMGGPRCCKQAVYASIHTGFKSILEYYNQDYPAFMHNIRCMFLDKISDCKKDRCPYLGK